MASSVAPGMPPLIRVDTSSFNSTCVSAIEQRRHHIEGAVEGDARPDGRGLGPELTG